MLQALFGLLRTVGTRVASAASRAEASVSARAKRFTTPDPAAVAAHKRKPSKFPRPRSPAADLLHQAGELGQASWGIDAISSRFNSSAPTFMEVVSIKVWGQAWASVQDLYVLAMCVLVARVDGRAWQGAQGLRALVDVTGKYVEVEFNQAKRGTVERAVTFFTPGAKGPHALFHDHNWLTNEVSVLSKPQAVARLPDVIGGFSGNIATAPEADAALYHPDQAQGTLDEWGAWTANRLVNEGGAGSNEGGPLLLTGARDINPYPVSDGSSRGTDLCALVAQALHDPCDPPPVPETDLLYRPEQGPEPGGCRTFGGRPSRGRDIFGYLVEGWKNRARWLRGWVPFRAATRAGGIAPATDDPRGYGPTGC